MNCKNVFKLTKAFTLLEILLVVAAIAVLAGIVILAINPSKQLADIRNSQRRVDVKTISDAVYQYIIDNGSVPTAIPTSLTSYGICLTGATTTNCVDLSVLTDNQKYLAEMPVDPSGAINTNDSNYYVMRTVNDRIIVWANASERENNICSNSDDSCPPDASTFCGGSISYDNHVYNIVQIGDQCWFKESLKTTRYNNNSPIPNLTDNTAWANDTLGAYSCYNNDPTNCTTYGVLYNFSAVVNPNGLCPSGWHVPTHYEFVDLERAVCLLGGVNSEATCNARFPKDYTTVGWLGVDEGTKLKVGGITGFEAIMTGRRLDDGSFLNIGDYNHLWSSEAYDSTYSILRLLGFAHGGVYQEAFEREMGFAVRCLKD